MNTWRSPTTTFTTICTRQPLWCFHNQEPICLNEYLVLFNFNLSFWVFTFYNRNIGNFSEKRNFISFAELKVLVHSTPLALWRGVGGEAFHFSFFTFHSKSYCLFPTSSFVEGWRNSSVLILSRPSPRRVPCEYGGGYCLDSFDFSHPTKSGNSDFDFPHGVPLRSHRTAR